MTAQLSRERLEEKLLEHIKHGGDSEEETMIRMLLAGMDSKPVEESVTCWSCKKMVGVSAIGYCDGYCPNCNSPIDLDDEPYITTPPAPAAVPDVDPRDAFEALFPISKYAERCGAGYCCTAYSAWGAQDFIQKWNGWNACRAAMLKAEPVMPAAVADQTAAKEKLLELLQRGIDFQSADIPVNATSAPMQPLEFDDRGTLRFKENKIVRRLLDYSKQRGYGLNEIALEDFTDDDRMQLAQLIGYSLSGYGELSYVSDESWERAAAATPEKEE